MRLARWSVSAGQDRGRMEAFVGREPHLGISARLDHCRDEATFVDWEQPSPDLPDWQTSWRHLTADGKVAELTRASAANQTRDFPRRSSRLRTSPEPPRAPHATASAAGDRGSRRGGKVKGDDVGGLRVRRERDLIGLQADGLEPGQDRVPAPA